MICAYSRRQNNLFCRGTVYIAAEGGNVPGTFVNVSDTFGYTQDSRGTAGYIRCYFEMYPGLSRQQQLTNVFRALEITTF